MLSPFRWPGGKNKLLIPIISYLTPMLENSNDFCEPFAGGACVSLEIASKYPNKRIFIADRDFGLASFWKIVSSNNNEQIAQLIKMLEIKPTLDLFFKLKETISDDPLLCAYKTIFLNRTAFSGILTSGPIGGLKQDKYKIDCRFNNAKLQKQIQKCNLLLKNRTIVSCCDFRNFEPLMNNKCIAYIDPPYVKVGHILYNFSLDGKDHNDLAGLLSNRSNYLLSYDDHPIIRELYKNQTILDLKAKYSINGTKKNWTNKNELLIMPKPLNS